MEMKVTDREPDRSTHRNQAKDIFDTEGITVTQEQLNDAYTVGTKDSVLMMEENSKRPSSEDAL